MRAVGDVFGQQRFHPLKVNCSLPRADSLPRMSNGWTSEDIPDQSGRTAIVTGGNSGIGFEAAPVDVLNTPLNLPRNWMPTTNGAATVREIGHELLGSLGGA